MNPKVDNYIRSLYLTEGQEERQQEVIIHGMRGHVVKIIFLHLIL